MAQAPAYFTRLLPALAERSRSATLSRLGFAHAPLYRHLTDLFNRPYGQDGSLLGDPTFEAVFGWQEDGATMDDLVRQGLLSPALVDALDDPPDPVDDPCPAPTRAARRAQHPYRFGRDRRPYRHQREAWQCLARDPPQSLVVASGTGSGKTECFMVPILDRLVRAQAAERVTLVGVRALFLYPLNALINSQRERLRAWTHHFDGSIRFCLFNGNTPERLPAGQANRHPGEVRDRKGLRDRPPPILVTNATMLEYMLVRTLDAPILEQSQGRLEWVVLDEAHTYIGSQAAELALLLRRVLHAFGVASEQVRFVATSATIGDPDGEAGNQLRRFLAEVAGVQLERVHLVAGRRTLPAPGRAPEADDCRGLDALAALDAEIDDRAPAAKRHAALTAHPVARRLRDLFIANDRGHRERGGSGLVANLGEVCRVLGATGAPNTEQQREALAWLDLLSGTRDADGRPFLPLRAHLFHQTVSGLWACADPHCPERAGTPLADEDWPFGALYPEPRQHCRCGAPVYEVVACGDCGAPHQLASIRNGCLVPPRAPNAIDEFELDLESEADGGDEPDVGDGDQDTSESRVLISNRPGLPQSGEELIERQSRRLVDRDQAGETLRLVLREDAGDGLVCPCCGDEERGRKLFQEARIGAPFALGIILPTLLEFAPDERCKPAELPSRGRRLLTFNDSRQGTARMAARLQQEAERNRVRALVYHLTLREGRQQTSAEANKLAREIAYNEALLDHTPAPEARKMIAGRLAEYREQMAALTQPTPVAFDDLARHLADTPQDFDWMLAHYRRFAPSTFTDVNGKLTLARMFLVREFARRPKRLNNLETMGMVAVCYPALARVTRSWDRFSIDEWRDLLKISLDFFIRAQGVLAVDEPIRHWLGTRIPRRWLVERDRAEIGRGELRWPLVARGGLRSTLVRLLAHVLKADVETAYGRDLVDHALAAAWQALTIDTGLLVPEAGGVYKLPLPALAFMPMTKAWVCPVTRRLLDVTLRGSTPYLPRTPTDATARCEPVKIPLYDQPFGAGFDPLAQVARARDWLARQPAIDQLRADGLWQALNDRVIELAPYFTAAEHSAQQPSWRLEEYEGAFKRGRLNLLSCSTTMEMGIDIGGVALVAMNNVPPHPANYLQRAGRAGRRQEARSVALTLCKSNPHDQIVFHQTDWPFTTPLPAPQVSLNSPVIVQRHVNALVLAAFLRHLAAGTGQNALNLECGWFFVGADGKTPAARFIAWCDAKRRAAPELERGLRQLVRNSAFADLDPVLLLRRTGAAMAEVVATWTGEWEALCRAEADTRAEGLQAPDWSSLCAQGGRQPANAAQPANPANQAVRYQACRMFGEYLLRELADQGFLPAYGFPTHLAAFDNYTLAQWQQDLQQRRTRNREDNRFHHRELANRDSVTALREYAPGADVVMDGLVYRAAGITLNWKVPATATDVKEIVAIRYAWRCNQCGATGGSRAAEEAKQCGQCGAPVTWHSNVQHSALRTYLSPAGYAVDFYQDAHNNVDTQAFIPVEPAWVSAQGDWRDLPNPALGRFRCTTRGHLFHQSNGLHGQGYAVCLLCGRAAPMGHDPDPMPEVFTRPHKKLRGSRQDGGGDCPGSDPARAWAIKTGLSLGHETHTDVLELQLRNRDGVWLNDRTAALTLAVVLRDALAGLLGVRADELGCTEKDARPGDEARGRSILIYDRFAAGYASSVVPHLSRLFHAARERLLCPAECDSACPRCVLDFDQRFLADSLDRYAALKFLTSDWLDDLRLPQELQWFGPTSQMEFAPLDEALLLALRVGSGRTTRLFASGSDGDLGPSPLRALAYRLAGLELPVELALDQATLTAMSDEDCDLIASLADHPRISVGTIASLPRSGEGQVIACVFDNDQARCWARAGAAALAPNLDWGTGGPLITAPVSPTALARLKPVAAAALRRRPLQQGDLELVIQHELDGPISGFGGRFWDHLAKGHGATATCLTDGEANLVGLAYRDRYLLAPLPVALLFSVLMALRKRLGDARCATAQVRIRTSSDAPPANPRPPRQLWHNWPSISERDTALRAVAERSGLDCAVDTRPKATSEHGRRLELTFDDGQLLAIRLDQGFGYWRAGEGIDPQRGRFDFDASPARQAAALLQPKGVLSGGSQPTWLFLSQRRRNAT